MDKIVKFIDCYIATETCNLRCKYCYITQQRKFNNRLAEFTHTPEEIRKALSKKRFGGGQNGCCLINFCAGGETLLAEPVLDIVKELLKEGHYIMVVTNGTLTGRFKSIAGFPEELRERLFFKFSFHYLELKRLGLIEAFFCNVHMMQEAGCSFTVEMTPSDAEIPYMEEIKQCCLKHLDSLCHLTIARDDRTKDIHHLSELGFEEFTGIWSSFHSSLFDFKKSIFYVKRKEFCYAGDWSVTVNLTTGDMHQCYCAKKLDNIYEDMDRPLYFEPIGRRCRSAHCYNGHAFLTLGTIPELNTPTFASLRNNKEGLWLNDKVRAVMEQKLGDNNRIWTEKEKKYYRITAFYKKAVRFLTKSYHTRQ